jgi:hypothetical protein
MPEHARMRTMHSLVRPRVQGRASCRWWLSTVVSLALAVFVAGCGSSGGVKSTLDGGMHGAMDGAGGGADGPSRHDGERGGGGGGDAGMLHSAPDGGGCVATADCGGGGLVCVGGQCISDPCDSDAGKGLACGNGLECQATCESYTSPCVGFSCPDGEVCVIISGSTPVCAPACYQVPCEDISCPPGQVCNPSLDFPKGACAPYVPCDATCPTGQECTLGCVAVDDCEHVSCPSDEVCDNGKCKPDPCAKIVCPPGDFCLNGLCYFSCPGPCNPICPPTGTPPGGAFCGGSDACGGVCGTATTGCAPGQTCTCTMTDANGTCIAKACECAPECTGKACGADNGCGGTCNGTCPTGEMCQNDKTCVCAPDCTGKACGADNGCNGICDEGTCSTGFCFKGTCCTPSCAADAVCGSSDGCGEDCNGSCTGGATCIHDGAADYCQCPTGQAYENGACVCAPKCNASSRCGESDGCNGTCAGACGCSETCTNAHVCVPLCASGQTVCGCTSCCTSPDVCNGSVCTSTTPPP